MREDLEFETESAALDYYQKQRADVLTRHGRVVSRSSILKFIGKGKTTYWALHKVLNENAGGDFLRF